MRYIMSDLKDSIPHIGDFNADSTFVAAAAERWNAGASNLSFDEEMVIIPALQSAGELRRAAANHRASAQLATEEAERALGEALSDGDESGGEAYSLFLLAEAHEDAARRLDAAAALLDEAKALVVQPFSPPSIRARAAQEAFNNASSPEEAQEAAGALEEALGAP